MEVNIFKSLSASHKFIVLPVDIDVDSSQYQIDDADYAKVYFLRTRTLQIGKNNVDFDPASAIAAITENGFYLYSA